MLHILVGSPEQCEESRTAVATAPAKQSSRLAIQNTIGIDTTTSESPSITDGKETIMGIEPNDILLVRGRSYLKRPGNVRFQEIVSRHQDDYMWASKNCAKQEIVRRIVHEIDGRFLRQCKSGQGWVEIPGKVARIKVAQALQYRHRQATNDVMFPTPSKPRASPDTHMKIPVPCFVARGSSLSQNDLFSSQPLVLDLDDTPRFSDEDLCSVLNGLLPCKFGHEGGDTIPSPIDRTIPTDADPDDDTLIGIAHDDLPREQAHPVFPGPPAGYHLLRQQPHRQEPQPQVKKQAPQPPPHDDVVYIMDRQCDAMHRAYQTNDALHTMLNIGRRYPMTAQYVDACCWPKRFETQH